MVAGTAKVVNYVKLGNRIVFVHQIEVVDKMDAGIVVVETMVVFVLDDRS
jgi:hypothetical protein